MKYENFHQIVELVNKIKEHEKLLAIIDSDPIVMIKRPYVDEIIRIDNDKSDFGTYALNFIDIIREDIQERIDNIKSMLEQL